MKFSPFLFLLYSLIAWPSFALESVTLQLRWHHQAQFAGYYMAQVKGFYREADINATIVPGGEGINPLEQVMNNRADFGVGNTEVLIGFGQGQPVTALAAIYQHSPSILLARSDSQIDTLTDLKGKRVMIFAGSTDAELISLLTGNQIRLNEFEAVNTSGNIQDLLSGRVDVFNGYLNNEPYLLKESGVKPVIFQPAQHGIDFYSDILFTHRHTAEQKPDLAERFRTASIKGWYYALSHPEETLDVIESHYPSRKTREHLAYELETSRPMILADLIEIGHMNPHRWQTIADQLSRHALMPPTTINAQFLFHYDAPDADNHLLAIANSVFILLGLTTTAAFLYIKNARLKREVSLHKLARERANRQARRDPLTGVANRVALREMLWESIYKPKNKQAYPVLLFIDLDNFKTVNDTYGHQVGDMVLQQFCQRVKALLSGSDAFFARLAGDEFVVLLPDAPHSAAESLSQQLNQLATEPFQMGKQSIHIGASIGVTRYRQGDTPDYFLSRADTQMYKNKKRSRQERSSSELPISDQ